MPYPRSLDFLFLNRTSTRRYIPAQAEGRSIPRIVHQTYRAWDALAPEIQDAIAGLRARNSGWDYRFYDDAAMVEFVRSVYGPAVLARLLRIDPRYGAARADLFRYLLLYHYGGVYLDIKSTALRPLDEIVRPEDRMILAQWRHDGRFEGAGIHDWDFADRIDGGEFQQWHVICSPGHPYLYAVIQAVMRNIDCYIPGMHGSGRNAVLRVTGPIAYTLAILPLLPAGLHRLVKGHEALGLAYSVFPGNADHKRLFGTHYSDLTAPVVRAGAVRSMLAAAYGVLAPLRRRVARAG